MSYRHGNRDQISFLPNCIEDYVGPDDPVRAYDAFVDTLNLGELGILLDEYEVGNSKYDPVSMLKLLIYGCSYGIRSSRKLERALHHNLSFIWISGGLRPDHKTISEFRRRHRLPLQKAMRQCARMCLKMGLIEGNTLFVDGTKIKGNASLRNTWTQERCELVLQRVDQRIEEILSECDKQDDVENGNGSLVALNHKLSETGQLKKKVMDILQQIKDKDAKSVNTVDQECTVVYGGKRGSSAGYNAQVTVDKENGLIVNTDVVSENYDHGQLPRQVEQANHVLGKSCDTVVADAGYHRRKEVKDLDNQGIRVIAPSGLQAREQGPPAFWKRKFRYNKKKDLYICPEGHQLRKHAMDNRRGRIRYMITDGKICQDCRNFGVCTRSKSGRCIGRFLDEDQIEKLRKQYEANQSLYKLRKQKSELPFAHLRQNYGMGNFLLRGILGTKAEMALFGISYNLTRIMNMLGTKPFIAKLAS